MLGIGTDPVQFEAWSVLIDWGSSMENNQALMTNLARASTAIFLRDHMNSIKVLNWIDSLLILRPMIMWTYTQMNVGNLSNDESVDSGSGLTFLWLAFVAKVVADRRIVNAIIRNAYCRCLNNPRLQFNRQAYGCFDDMECCIA
jgi:hypothetical protein